jgi:hypothetical protein
VLSIFVTVLALLVLLAFPVGLLILIRAARKNATTRPLVSISSAELPECDCHPSDLLQCDFYKFHPANSETVYIGCAENKEWANVYASVAGKYVRYGYSIEGERWARNQQPENVAVVERYVRQASALTRRYSEDED